MKRFFITAIVLLSVGLARAGDPWRGQWIWDTPRANVDSQPKETRYFRKFVTLAASVNQDHTLVMADNSFHLYVNGKEVLSGAGAWPSAETDLTSHLQKGRNVIALSVTNEGAQAGLYFESNLKTQQGELIAVVSDDTWRTSQQEVKNWTAGDFDDAGWKSAVELGPMGIAPWGKHGKPGDAAAKPVADGPLPAAESIKTFTGVKDFELRVIAQEPDVVNPVAMAMDDAGRFYVSEAHTYRYGPEGSPVKPPSNPIVLLEMGPDGHAHKKSVVADGYEDPIMGLAIRGQKIWIASLNQLLVADLHADGTIGPQKVLVRDLAKPWNPFGFYRVQFGPDGWIYLIIGDHEAELTGSDGRQVKNRGSTGMLVRCKPDGSKLELLVQGMRAPFSFDFDAFGHIWILSNGEGNPNRLLMMVPGLDYHFQTRHGDWAWLAGANPWSPPVTEMERGANTQVLCYRDSAFPEKYDGQLFVANWGAHGFASVNHKIDLYAPDARGKIENVSVFFNGADPMFRPTQLSADRDGNLYMLDWYGKDDENDLTGRIYKIVYTGSDKPAPRTPPHITAPPGTQLTKEMIEQAQGLASANSWTRAHCADALVADASPAMLGTLAATVTPDANPEFTGEILRVLYRIGTPVIMDTIASALRHKDARVRAMALRLLRNMSPSDLARRVELLANDADPEVRVEYALCQDSPPKVVAGLLGALQAGAVDDRRLRYQCAAELSRRMTPAQYLELVRNPSNIKETKALTGWIALDVALLEKVNPGAREVLTALLNASGAQASDVITVADRWASPAEVPALQNYLKQQIASGQSAGNIAAAFAILRRFGPAAMEGVSDDAQKAFFEQIAAGRIQLPTPDDRIAALKLLASVDVPGAAPKLIVAMLADDSPEVRQEALRTVRLIGWQSPELFGLVWAHLRDPALDVNERLTGIVTLSRQEKPDMAGWRGLLASPSVLVLRTALRVCKQFAGNDDIRDLVLAEAPRLIASHPELKDEIVAVLSLFTVDAVRMAALNPGPAPSSQKPQELENQMLSRLASAEPRLGQDVFEKAGCIACHDVSGSVQRFGPALKDIGKGASAASIAESILFPSRVIKDGFDTQVIRTKDGQELEGWVEQHGNEVIVVRGGAERVRVSADQIAERRKLGRSPMPDVTLDGMCIDELTDLLGYLVSQGGNLKAPPTSQPSARPVRAANARSPRKKTLVK